MKTKLSHVDDDGRLSMVDVGEKKPSDREAVASAVVRMSRSTIDLVVAQALPKGDVLTTARVAGILAAKQTPALIPLTHTLALNFVGVEFNVDAAKGTITIEATVRCHGRTGV